MSTSAAVSKHRSRAERTATDSPWPARMARLGLVSRGMMHLLVGWLALKIAFGDSAEKADQKGALSAAVRQPFGRLLVLALAIGFLSYASWRLIEAALNPESKSTLKRIGYAARGLLYIGFFATALSFVFGQQKQGGGSGGQQDATARVLEWSFGRPLVVIVGLVVIAAGIWNGWRGLSRKFEKDLKRYEMSKPQSEMTTKIAIVGHIGRMAAYLLVGGFIVRAAVRFRPSEGVGLDAALHELATKAYGPWMLAAVAIGLIAFGIYQLILVRYRQVLGS